MAQIKIENVTRSDPESWLKAIWAALDQWDDYVLDDVPAGEADDELHRENHDELCTAMAWIREELGLPSETEAPINDYEQRVRALEAEGCTRSDAQAIVDAERKNQ